MSAAQTSLSAHASGPEDPPQAPTGHGDDEGGFFQRNKLKVLLILLDTVSIGLSYFIVLFAGTYVRDTGTPKAFLLIAAAVAGGLWAERSQGLMLARVSAAGLVLLWLTGMHGDAAVSENTHVVRRGECVGGSSAGDIKCSGSRIGRADKGWDNGSSVGNVLERGGIAVEVQLVVQRALIQKWHDHGAPGKTGTVGRCFR